MKHERLTAGQQFTEFTISRFRSLLERHALTADEKDFCRQWVDWLRDVFKDRDILVYAEQQSASSKDSETAADEWIYEILKALRRSGDDPNGNEERFVDRVLASAPEAYRTASPTAASSTGIDRAMAWVAGAMSLAILVIAAVVAKKVDESSEGSHDIKVDWDGLASKVRWKTERPGQENPE